MSLAAQYALGGADHFDPEEVMKVPQISKILTGPGRPFRMNNEESDLDAANPM